MKTWWKKFLALEETADAEIKEDNESKKRKAEKEEAEATDMRPKELEKLSETMMRYLGENDLEKVKKREWEKWQRDPVIPVRKSGKRPGTYNSNWKKEQHDLDAKRQQTSIDQQQQLFA